MATDVCSWKAGFEAAERWPKHPECGHHVFLEWGINGKPVPCWCQKKKEPKPVVPEQVLAKCLKCGRNNYILECEKTAWCVCSRPRNWGWPDYAGEDWPQTEYNIIKPRQVYKPNSSTDIGEICWGLAECACGLVEIGIVVLFVACMIKFLF